MVGQAPAVLLLDDAAREREPDPPAAGLGGRARLEQAAADLWGQPGTIVVHAHAGDSPERVHGNVDASAASRERIDGVLDHRLDGPLDEHRVAERRGPRAGP